MHETGSEQLRRVCLIGPTYPYRGGIAHYTTLLAKQLQRAAAYDVLLISFSRQYPGWLFPGRHDRDPSVRPLRTEAEYLLNPLNPLTWWRTWRRIKAWAPDLLVIPWWVPFWAPVWGILGRAVKRLPQPPRLIFICHNVLPHESSFLDGLALRWALAPGDGFLMHSQADGARLRTYFPEAPLRVSPLPSYGPLLQDRDTTRNLRLPDVPLLLFCGFVRPYKGLDLLLHALPDVLRCRQVHLLVAGEFWQGEEPYRELVSELQLEEAVTFENRYVPDDELAAYLDAADVVVLPYRHATQSAVVQLAFGRRRPVITTDVGGLAEAVDHERTGLVVPPEDPQALAQAILRYFDEDLRETFAANIEREQERFSWERLVEQLQAVANEGRQT